MQLTAKYLWFYLWLECLITAKTYTDKAVCPVTYVLCVAVQVLMDLISGGYHVVTDTFLSPEHITSSSSRSQLGREQVACVDYYMALAADKFIGNSVSSFSAMIILERQRHDAWASYYNGGNVPLSEVLPLYQLPWVFTYNSWSSPYDYMLKAAVRSGLDHGHGRLKPYCLFAGSRKAPIIKWLEVSHICVQLFPFSGFILVQLVMQVCFFAGSRKAPIIQWLEASLTCLVFVLRILFFLKQMLMCKASAIVSVVSVHLVKTTWCLQIVRVLASAHICA